MSVGEERFVQAITLKLKAGPASPGVLGTDGGSGGGDSVAGGHRGGGAQPNHGSVKWAPLSTTRRIGSGGERGFRSPRRPACCITRMQCHISILIMVFRRPCVMCSKTPIQQFVGPPPIVFGVSSSPNRRTTFRPAKPSKTFTRTPHVHIHIRRIPFDNPGGPKRPLKLTSMHFTSEDERGGSGSRGAPRSIVMGVSAGAGNGGNGGGGHGGSNGRTSLGGGGTEKSGATTLATLDVGARVSPALPYGKSVSLPAGGSGIGLIGGRFER